MCSEDKRAAIPWFDTAYYDDEISHDQLEALFGAEEAANLRVLKQQLEGEQLRAAGPLGARGRLTANDNPLESLEVTPRGTRSVPLQVGS